MKSPSIRIFLLAGAALFSTSFLSATQTQPVGFTTWTINGGDGVTRSLSVLGAPLYQPASSIEGVSRGVISSVSNDSITVTGAGWSPGDLSNSAAPFVVRITSGSAKGRNLLVSSTSPNTSDTVTINLALSDISDVSQLGIVTGQSGDSFEIVECDTLLSLFGDPSDGVVVGAETVDDADIIFLLDSNGIWNRYYFDTSSDKNRWTRVARGSPDASSTPLLPDSGMLFSRKSSGSSDVILTGTVPNTGRQVSVNGQGVSFLASSFPSEVELSETGISSISGWEKNSDSAIADVVYVFSGGIWLRFYNDGINWRQIARGNPIQDDFKISVGSAVLLLKRSDAGNDLVLNQTLPYTL